MVVARPRVHRELVSSRHWPLRRLLACGDGMVDVGR
jgi:hypothetical protein